MEDNFSKTSEGVERDVFGMIQIHYIYCALYFCYYYIGFTSEQQASDP